MPRRFSAPIPVWRSFGPRRPAPARSTPYELMDKSAVERYFRDRAGKNEEMARTAGLPFTDPDLWDKCWGGLGEQLEVFQVVDHIVSIEYATRLAAAGSADALTVDDFFQMYIHPSFDAELLLYFNQLLEIEANGGAGIEGWRARVSDWLGVWGDTYYPGLRKESVAEALKPPRGVPPCWHGQDHANFVRPGRRWKLERRAATWGTYILAWVVGSETLAVRFWNSLPLPPAYRWSQGKPLNKYVEAKNRLVKELWATGLLGVRSHQLTPYPPLHTDITKGVEEMLAMVATEDALSRVEAIAAETLPISA